VHPLSTSPCERALDSRGSGVLRGPERLPDGSRSKRDGDPFDLCPGGGYYRVEVIASDVAGGEFGAVDTGADAQQRLDLSELVQDEIALFAA
jgi:hypothetical protein